MAFEHPAKAVASIDPFADRNRDADLLGDLLERAEIERVGRLLDQQDVELLEPPAQANGFVRGQAAAQIHHEVDAGADRPAYRPHLLDREIGGRTIDRTPADVSDAAVGPWRRQRVTLQRGVAVADRALGRFGIFVRSAARIRPAVGIGAHPVAAFAAQELVDRDADGFSLDVPQRLLDRADSREDDGAPALQNELSYMSAQSCSMRNGSLPSTMASTRSFVMPAAAVAPIP